MNWGQLRPYRQNYPRTSAEWVAVQGDPHLINNTVFDDTEEGIEPQVYSSFYGVLPGHLSPDGERILPGGGQILPTVIDTFRLHAVRNSRLSALLSKEAKATPYGAVEPVEDEILPGVEPVEPVKPVEEILPGVEPVEPVEEILPGVEPVEPVEDILPGEPEELDDQLDEFTLTIDESPIEEVVIDEAALVHDIFEAVDSPE